MAAPRAAEYASTPPQIKVTATRYGRIESIPSRRPPAGVVIAAPHGTFDEHTDMMVEQVSRRTGFAALIARGFTPAECGGWRINVNRPTETRYPLGEIEIRSERAEQTYAMVKQSVFQLSRGALELYIDVHQNGRTKNIEVATVGLTPAEARLIKKTYRALRDQVVRRSRGAGAVDLLIEPIDSLEIGAWAAKTEGILAAAKKALHFEFPLHATLGTAEARQAYTDILAALLERTVPVLLDPGAVFNERGAKATVSSATPSR